MNDLLQALLDLPPVDAPVPWPDPPDLNAEYITVVLMASPVAGQRIKAAIEVLLDRARTLDDLIEALDAVAIRFSQDGDAETCAAFLDLSGVIRDWRNHK
jgi:hypothetical protein